MRAALACVSAGVNVHNGTVPEAYNGFLQVPRDALLFRMELRAPRPPQCKPKQSEHEPVGPGEAESTGNPPIRPVDLSATGPPPATLPHWRPRGREQHCAHT